MKELLDLGLKEYAPEQVGVAGDYECPFCSSDDLVRRPKKHLGNSIVGWCFSFAPHTYAVLECQDCFQKYRNHIHAFRSAERERADFVKAAKNWIERSEGMRSQ